MAVVLDLGLAGCQLIFPYAPPPVDERIDIDGTVDEPGCSPMSLLTNDFEDGNIAPWINDRSTRFQVSAGALRASLLGNQAQVRTEPYFDLANSALGVTVDLQGGNFIDNEAWLCLETPPTTGATDLNLETACETDRPGIVMRVAGSQLQVGFRQNKVFQNVKSVVFDPSQHKRWRVYDAAGAAMFATSPDGGVFTDFQRLAIDTSIFRPALVGRAVAASYQVAFDNINDGGPRAGTVCRIDSIVDSFKKLDMTVWGRSATSQCEVTANDGLRLTPTAPQFSCRLGTTTVRDLIGQQIVIEPVIPSGSNNELRFEVQNLKGVRGGIRYVANSLESYTQQPGAATTDVLKTVPYTASQHPVWRIQAVVDATGEQLIFEAGVGETGFTPLLQTNLVSGLDAVVVDIRYFGVETTAVTINHFGGSRL